MDPAVDGATLFQNFPGIHQPFQMGVHREVRELPLYDPGEPHQGAHIQELDRTETFFPSQNGKTGLFELLRCHLQVLFRERNRRLPAEERHQFPVILRSHLLGDKQAAGFQNPVNLFRVEIPMPVDDHVEAVIFKGQFPLPVAGPEIDA